MKNSWCLLVLAVILLSCNSIKFSTPQSNFSSNSRLQSKSSQDVSSIEILDQIVWVNTGGGETLPYRYCGDCDVIQKGTNVQLIDFKPKQELILLVYQMIKGKCEESEHVAKYNTSINVTVDSSGNLNFNLSESSSVNFIFAVYDNKSKKLEWQDNLPLVDHECSMLDQFSKGSSSDSCVSTRIKIGDRARVTITDGTPTRIRTEPRISQSTYITSIKEGTKLEIIRGPECNNNYIWWYVKTADGYEGWMAEGTSSNWFIESIE